MSDPTPCAVPLTTFTWCDKRITVHSGIVAPLKRIEAKWKAKGGHSAYRIGPNTWGYNCRKTRSGRRWSDHAKGWALDINSESNPYGKNLVTNMPKWFVDLFKAEGFGWGGDWQSVKDAMHFSKNPAEGGNGKLEPLPTQEEDELADAKTEILAAIKTLQDDVDSRIQAIEEKVTGAYDNTRIQTGGEIIGLDVYCRRRFDELKTLIETQGGP